MNKHSDSKGSGRGDVTTEGSQDSSRKALIQVLFALLIYALNHRVGRCASKILQKSTSQSGGC